MLKLLIAIDGSANALRALDHVLHEIKQEGRYTILLLNVQLPVASGHARMFISKDDLQNYYREEGSKQLVEAQARLDAAQQTYESFVVVGHPATCIVQAAEKYAVDRIVIGTHGHSAFGHMMLGSAADEIIRSAKFPVLLVP